MAKHKAGSGAAGRRSVEDRKWAEFLERMATLFGTHEDGVFEVFGDLHEFSGRVNRLHVDGTFDAVEAAARQGMEIVPLPWFPDGFTFTFPKRTLAESELCSSGELFVQNASSFLPVLALQPQAGERILDACAAPGGKTSMIAALTGNGAELWANDGIESRIANLRDVQRILGFDLAQVTTHPTQYIDKFVDERFDRVLLDAQCSGEGMVNLSRRNALQYWSPERITKYRRLQTKMLSACFKLLRPGGVLVYSTCTLSPEEDEAPVSTLLSRNADAMVEPVVLDVPNALAGVTKWRGERFEDGVRGALRIRPEGAMEGFFLCRIRKVDPERPVDEVEALDLALVSRSERGLE
jgi:16S rRNA C967 or C1407 C5-methylase (RsmB/RsmF family)